MKLIVMIITPFRTLAFEEADSMVEIRICTVTELPFTCGQLVRGILWKADKCPCFNKFLTCSTTGSKINIILRLNVFY